MENRNQRRRPRRSRHLPRRHHLFHPRQRLRLRHFRCWLSPHGLPLAPSTTRRPKLRLLPLALNKVKGLPAPRRAPRKCCKQTTYGLAKPSRSNTYRHNGLTSPFLSSDLRRSILLTLGRPNMPPKSEFPPTS